MPKDCDVTVEPGTNAAVPSTRHEGADVVRLELNLAVPETAKTKRTVSALARKFGRATVPADGHLLTEALLSEDDSDPRYLVVHLDREEAEGQRYVFATLTFDQKPSHPPPAHLTKRREAGLTIEWFTAEWRKITKDQRVGASITATLSLRSLPSSVATVTAPSVTVGRQTLTLAGAEFRSPTRSGGGVRSFRWARPADAQYTAWITVVVAWKEDRNGLWQRGSKLVLRHLRELS